MNWRGGWGAVRNLFTREETKLTVTTTDGTYRERQPFDLFDYKVNICQECGAKKPEDDPGFYRCTRYPSGVWRNEVAEYEAGKAHGAWIERQRIARKIRALKGARGWESGATMLEELAVAVEGGIP